MVITPKTTPEPRRTAKNPIDTIEKDYGYYYYTSRVFLT